MNDLSLYSSQPVMRDARRAGRAISRYQTDGQVRVARLDTEADVAAAKGDIYTAATGSAMGNVVRVAQAQRQLEQLAPEASSRLAMLAGDHALTMAEILGDLRWDLGRR